MSFAIHRQNWGGRWGLNPRPLESQSSALPAELRPPLTRHCTSNPKSGAPGRTRTCNHRLRRPVLCPVELQALYCREFRVVGVDGFEPPTLCSQSRCATRLRYTPICTRHCIIAARPSGRRMIRSAAGSVNFRPTSPTRPGPVFRLLCLWYCALPSVFPACSQRPHIPLMTDFT